MRERERERGERGEGGGGERERACVCVCVCVCARAPACVYVCVCAHARMYALCVSVCARVSVQESTKRAARRRTYGALTKKKRDKEKKKALTELLAGALKARDLSREALNVEELQLQFLFSLRFSLGFSSVSEALTVLETEHQFRDERYGECPGD